MCKVVAVTSQKGGAGKTTVALALAGHALAAGKAVVIIDLDPQASATTFRDLRAADDLIVEAVPSSRLAKAIADARQIADLVIIDTAPHAEAPALAAARAADVLVIPCRPGVLDVAAIATTIDMARLAGKRPVVVVNAARPNSRQAVEVIHALADAATDISPAVLSLRADFGDAIAAGQTVQEFAPAGKAAAEANALGEFILARMSA